MTALLTATLTLAACAGGTPSPKGGDPTDVQATAPGKATWNTDNIFQEYF